MVNYILMDQEFDKIVDKIDLAIVKTCWAKEHVTEEERGIWTIKDTSRYTVAKLRRTGITLFPKQLIIHLVYLSVFLINSHPATNVISEVFSQKEIVTRQVVD